MVTSLCSQRHESFLTTSRVINKRRVPRKSEMPHSLEWGISACFLICQSVITSRISFWCHVNRVHDGAWIGLLDDASTSDAHLIWKRIGWAEYTKDNGQT